MPVQRKEKWRQDTPTHQVRTILGAAGGHLLNAQEGINSERSIERALDFIREAQEILSQHVLDTWRQEDGD